MKLPSLKQVVIALVGAAVLFTSMLMERHVAAAWASRPEPAPSVTTVLYQDSVQKMELRSDGDVLDVEVVNEGFVSNKLRYIPIRQTGSGRAFTLVVPATEMFSTGQNVKVRSELLAGGLPGLDAFIFVLAE